ncbi:MAG: peptidylprolyl isomerase [Rickettsiales bacterium]|nr:peptidylprolyl isomerase [Rickettsiales bacterium]
MTAFPTLAADPANTLSDPENTLYMDLKDGRVVIELRADLAPNHVARIKELARQGFYDGIVFHRVIDGFMAQTGDPTGTGRGGSGQNLNAEFSDAKHLRGTVSMARGPQDVNSADSQFFICFDDQPALDGQYTIFGQVTFGMEHVDAIKRGNPQLNGMVTNPDKIITLRVAADVDQAATSETTAEEGAAEEAAKQTGTAAEPTEETKESVFDAMDKAEDKADEAAEKASGTAEDAVENVKENATEAVEKELESTEMPKITPPSEEGVDLPALKSAE